MLRVVLQVAGSGGTLGVAHCKVTRMLRLILCSRMTAVVINAHPFEANGIFVAQSMRTCDLKHDLNPYLCRERETQATLLVHRGMLPECCT